ncbi:cupin domain-containing protein [Pseudoalteromonas sp. G4]|uniref:cupin domain-containing protein n=1 Tax=Pseudoalteromonas sp. G4 TaxID=2992761 RepID=UPI00237E2C83|nr:cupin domain-containing protein [Pseudoalteromonas sp. G4]MDE3274080.1 cupin domain-containing protein [Pseudoalteromonas sp. G4]
MTLLLLSAAISSAPINIEQMVAPSDLENVKVVQLASNQDASQFLIFIKKSVPLHLHKEHSEMVYIVDGEGRMQLGDKSFTIKKGDFVKIDENTPHGVTVTSQQPLKVLSTQTPEYFGKDKHLVSEHE